MKRGHFIQFKVALLSFTFLSVSVMAQGVKAVVQKGHAYEINTFVLSDDSLYVATCSNDKTAKLWDYRSGRELRTFYHEFKVNALALSPDSKQLMTLSEDGSIQNQWITVWDLQTGAEIYKFNNPSGVHKIAYGPGYWIIAGYDNVSLIDSRTHEEIKQIQLPDHIDESLEISKDGKWVGVISYFEGTLDKKVDVYSVPQLKLVSTTPTDGDRGQPFIKFDPFSNYVYLVNREGPFKKIELSTGKVVMSYDKEIRPRSVIQFNFIDVSPDGKQIFVGTRDDDGFDVKLWEIETGRDLIQFTITLQKAVNKISFTPDGHHFIYTTSDTIELQIIDSKKKHVRSIGGLLGDRDEGKEFFNYDYGINGLFIYMDDQHPIKFVGNSKLIKARFGSSAVMWNAATGKRERHFTGHRNSLFCFDISSDNKRMVTGGGDGKIILWNVESGDSLGIIQAYAGRWALLNLRFNPDNSDEVLSTSINVRNNYETVLKIHSLSTKATLVTYHYPRNENPWSWNHLAIWGKTSSNLYRASDSVIYLLETRTGKTIQTLQGHKDNVSSLSLSSDKKLLISTSWDGTICLWSTDTHMLVGKLIGLKDRIHQAVITKDGKKVYASSRDKSIGVWDLSLKVSGSGWNIKPITFTRLLEGHQDAVVSLALSADETILASYSRDGAVKFWDTRKNREFFEHIWFNEDEWIAKVPEGFFYATDKAQRYIHFVDGLQSYSIDQFFTEFYRPDLLPQLFKGRGASAAQGNLQEKVRKLRPLQVKAAIAPKTDPGKADVYAKVIGDLTEVTSLAIVHNGKVLHDYDIVEKLKRSPKGQLEVEVQLVSGINRFKVVATNRDNIEFSSDEIELFSELVSKNANCYVLSIGINQYKNPKLDLAYARPDAMSFTNMLSAKASLFNKVQVTELYNEDATKENVLMKLDEISKMAKLEDVFILFYAGHGTTVDDKFYFVPTDATRLYEASALAESAIEASAIQKKLNAINALKQLIILDACQSGSSVETLAVRGAVEEKALAQLSRSTGIHVLASAGSDQFSTEFASLKHGAFTYLILEAMNGQADGAPADGKITIYELKAFLDDQVPELTRKLKGTPQYPHTFSRGQDFPLILNQK